MQDAQYLQLQIQCLETTIDILQLQRILVFLIHCYQDLTCFSSYLMRKDLILTLELLKESFRITVTDQKWILRLVKIDMIFWEEELLIVSLKSNLRMKNKRQVLLFQKLTLEEKKWVLSIKHFWRSILLMQKEWMKKNEL